MSVPFRLLLICVLASCLSPRVFAEELHVSSDGPFKTIQSAVDRAEPGDTVVVHGGVHRESVVVTRGGEQGRPIRIVAAEGERVLFDGADAIDGDWRQEADGAWSVPVEGPVEQVFLGDEMLVEARWPNMAFPEQLWDRSCWASSVDGSDRGLMIDPRLAEGGVDWTGAIAMLNVSHQFWTWTLPVAEHAVGEDRFTYDPSNVGGMYDATSFIKYDDDHYYLFGAKAALDAPGEWFFDASEGRLFVVPPSDAAKANKKIRVKRRDYGLLLRGVEYVEVRGLDFFGCTFRIEKGERCTVADCHARFPSYSRTVIERTRGGKSAVTEVIGDGNRVERCSLAFASGSGLVVKGDGNVIDDNLVHDVCWSGSLDYAAIRVSGDGNIVRNNTVFNSGNVLITYGSGANIIERNHAYDGGWACHDVALLYSVTPKAGGSVVRYNWVHGSHAPSIALGIRADDKSRDVTVHHNVVWDCGWEAIVCKGDHHRVFHNTAFDNGQDDVMLYVGPEKDKDWQVQWKALEDQNQNSLIYNNAVQSMGGKRNKPEIRPGGRDVGNYEADDVKRRLRDPERLDFRPKADSPLVDRGEPVPGFESPFEGDSPDAGAYELGGEYWFPGITWSPEDVLGENPTGYIPTPRP